MNMAGGDNDQDDQAAAPYWDGADHTCWTLEAWRKSPRQMQAEAAADLKACMASVAGPAKRHDNPPLPPNRMRLL